jgi:hypothetical protein
MAVTNVQYLTYVRAGEPVEEPRLVVRLYELPARGVVGADVFDAPEGIAHVPVVIEDDRLQLDAALVPTIQIESLDGWWVLDGRTSFNLDITVNRGIQALWGRGWEAQVADGQPSVRISTRDPDGSGVPVWDLRELIPTFSLRGYYRVNYAESMCATALRVEESVSPEWPYVAETGRFEQLVGRVAPPIVVDWSRGRITHFSELVSVRNQSCSYSLYSIDPLHRDEDAINRLNFETPFAFYDLAGTGDGLPNLIVRTERYPAGDIWLTYPRANPQDYLEVRYSWRTEPGDQRWDYKVDLLGAVDYGFDTPIAGGLVRIDAPPYESFPGWVVEQDWPVATFVDTEGSSIRSSEGIYGFSSKSVGRPLFVGQDASPSEAYGSIRDGYRGEYRVGTSEPVALYISPIDNRLHLLGARAGVHNLGIGGILTAENLVPDEYLDSWRLDGPAGMQRLVHLPGWLVLADGTQFSLGAVDTPFSVGVVLPPTDHESWLAFRDRVLPITNAKRPANNLTTWFDAQADAQIVLDDVTVVDVWYQLGTARFLLEVATEAIMIGLEGTDVLTPGDWVLVFDLESRRWSTERARPAALSASISASGLEALSAQQVDLVMANTGTIASSGRAIVAVDGVPVASWDHLTVPADGTVAESFSWVPPVSGRSEVTLDFGGERYALGHLEVAAPNRAGLVTAAVLSLGPAALLLTIAALTAFAVASRAILGGRS